MNKKQIKIFIALFIVWFSVLTPHGRDFVLALTSTVTPFATWTGTATFIPPSSTPTSLSVSCPIGTPAGWGTYTPSPLWGLQCGACSAINTATPTATVTAAPTYYYSGTGTPPATYTPTATATSTPTATPTAVIYGAISCDTGDTNCSQVSADTLRISYSRTNAYCNGCLYLDTIYKYKLANVGTVYARVSWVPGSISTWHVGSNGVENTDIGVNKSGGYYYIDTVPDMNTAYQNYNTANHQTTTTSHKDISFYDNQANVVHNVNLSDRAPWSNGFRTTDVTTGTVVLISTNPQFNTSPTATPAPTSTPYFDTGYCSSIAPNPEADFGFELFQPDPSFPTPNCDIGWDEFTVGETTFPQVQICMQPSLFGVVTMFGQAYEIGTIAVAVAGAFIWRYMRTV